ncbi:hypothetical protein GGP41_008350 [Bipolaris sorokiniana]|uniref:Uncharacterized protein n=1 Tax=Cochliobolus sativus TaxID=45130 RepID=A0A8H5ZB08_COCSA|nr:hypothetical protein GGP41_008350 [Bipolaris sorokiniana]
MYARLLEADKEGCLHSGEIKLWAKLQWDKVGSIDEGRKAINTVLERRCRASISAALSRVKHVIVSRVLFTPLSHETLFVRRNLRQEYKARDVVTNI